MSDVSRYLKQEIGRLQDENRDLREEVISLREYVGAIHSLMNAIDELDPKDEVMPLLERILINAMAVTNAQDSSLLVTNDDGSELVFVLVQGQIPPVSLVGQRLKIGQGIAGWVAMNGKPTIVNNVRSDPRFYPGIDDAIQFQTNSILAVPIIGQGKVLGVIEVLNKNGDKIFEDTDQTLLMLLCRFAGDVLYAMAQQPEAGQSSAGSA